MDIQTQQNFLERQSDDYFAFAYALTPSRSKAKSLVKNAIQVLYVEGIDLVRDFTHIPRKGNGRRMQRYLYGKIFEFAGKISSSTGATGLTGGEEYSGFFRLPMKQRGLLFLKHKTDFDYTELEEITKMHRHEIISGIVSGREIL